MPAVVKQATTTAATTPASSPPQQLNISIEESFTEDCLDQEESPARAVQDSLHKGPHTDSGGQTRFTQG